MTNKSDFPQSTDSKDPGTSADLATTVDYAERRRRGFTLYEQVMARPAPAPSTPKAAALIDFVFGEIWSRPGLERKARRLIALSCAAGADDHESMADHAYGALASGDLTYDELLEASLHIAVYCGWPKATAFEHALQEQWEVLHKERGQPVPTRSEEPITSIPANQEERKQAGEEAFRVVNCVPSPPRDVPYYDDGILNYVFGDMWQRPGLNRRDRRWVTLACVGFDDTLIPVQSHVYSAMKTGDATYEEMREMVLQFAAYSGWPKASYVQQIVDEMHARIKDEDDIV